MMKLSSSLQYYSFTCYFFYTETVTVINHFIYKLLTSKKIHSSFPFKETWHVIRITIVFEETHVVLPEAPDEKLQQGGRRQIGTGVPLQIYMYIKGGKRMYV